MSQRHHSLLGVLVLGLAVPALLCAHRPITDPGTATTPAAALAIDDPDVSQVIYHEVRPGTSQLWLVVEANAGYDLSVSIGVPVIERLRSYRPALAIIGPGLPKARLPFPIPDKLGAVVLKTDGVTPRFFHEPITRTDSWILLERTLTLPHAGHYYVVAYSPTGTPGKLWVSVGTRERWSIADIFRLGRWTRMVRTFHEAP